MIVLAKEVIERYCILILHPGCAVVQQEGPGSGIGSLSHSWEQCPIQHRYRIIAKNHQGRLQKEGLTIGIWIKDDETSR